MLGEDVSPPRIAKEGPREEWQETTFPFRDLLGATSRLPEMEVSLKTPQKVLGLECQDPSKQREEALLQSRDVLATLSDPHSRWKLAFLKASVPHISTLGGCPSTDTTSTQVPTYLSHPTADWAAPTSARSGPKCLQTKDEVPGQGFALHLLECPWLPSVPLR